MRFLVIDDSNTDRLSLTSTLEKLGHQVDAIPSTEGALNRILSGSYEAVFLDIVMPEQDGYKFLREVRSHPPTAKQRVIFCSSKKTPLEVNYGVQRAGANAYLTKPVTPASLDEVLGKL